jgi:hypothetical protein
MSTTVALTSQLKSLKLGRMLNTLDVRLLQARQDQLGYMEFLQLLLQDEIERRRSQSLRMRLQRAAFEEPKTLEDFDFAATPSLSAPAVRDLATPPAPAKPTWHRPWDTTPAASAGRSCFSSPPNSFARCRRPGPTTPGTPSSDGC